MSKDLYFNNDNIPPGIEDPAFEKDLRPEKKRRRIVLPEGHWPEGLWDDINDKKEDKE